MRGVKGVAYRHTGQRQAAEDVAQAAFLVLAQRPRHAMRSARRRSSALPWLARVASYAASNWRRAEQRRARREKSVAQPERSYDPSAGHDLADAVRSAMACLPRRDRRIVEWRHLSQMSWDDVARHAGTTPEAARKAGQRAIASLRTVLERRGVTASAGAITACLGGLSVATSTSAAAAPTAASLAAGVLTMFKIQTAAVTTAVLLATGGLALTAAAYLQDDAPAVNQQQPRGLVGTLSDGTRVRLLAMGDQEGNWWQPDGAGDAEVQGQPALVQVDEGQMGLAAAFVVERPDGSSAGDASFSVPAGMLGYTTPGGGRYNLGFTAEAGAPFTTCTVFVPVGEPVNIGTAEPSYMNQMPFQGEDVKGRISPLGTYDWNDDGRAVTFATLFLSGDIAGKRPVVTLTLDDGSTVVGNAATSGGDVEAQAITLHFGQTNSSQVETIDIALQPLEAVRFGELATSTDMQTKPIVQALDHAAAAAAMAPPSQQPAWMSETTPEALALDQVPFEECLVFIGRMAGKVVTVDFDGLEAAGVDRTTEVSLQVPAGVEYGRVLRLVMNQAMNGGGYRIDADEETVSIGPAAGE